MLPGRLRIAGTLLTGLLAAAPAFGADGPDAAGPMFEALTIAGPGPSGRIVALGVDRVEVAPAEGPPKSFAAAELVRLSREGAATPGQGAFVVLPEGDGIARARIGAATDAAVEVEAGPIGKASIPLDAVLGLVLAPPDDPDALALLVRRVRTEPRAGEVAWLSNGDRLEGSFIGMDDQVVRLQVQGSPREIPRDGVVALGFDPALLSYPRPEGPFVEVGLLDGSRLGLAEARVERGRVLGVGRCKAKLDVALADVARVTPRTAAVEYLADRKPAKVSYAPYFDSTPPFQTDANVEGRPMTLGGRSYDRGLGAWSRTLLAYKLQAGDLRFQATVGVDERAGPLGSVTFRVLTDDGKARFASPPMTFRDAPQAVDVDLEGAKLLILDVEFGERGDVRDLADWAEARIIRRP